MGDIFTAVVLGLVQGVTEFLPISSSGHLVLMHQALHASDAQSLAFDAVLQLATGFATVAYFFPDLWRLFQTFLRMVGRMEVDARDKNLIYGITLGTIPALALGIFLEGYMETTFRTPLLVALTLVAGSALFAYAEYVYASKKYSPTEQRVTPQNGFTIGLFQALALIPGISRSGATISGALFHGFSRVEATRFSFLLSIPIILGSGGKKLLELTTTQSLTTLTPLFIGATVAFFVGLLAIHFMLIFVRNHTLWPFIWYRIALALVVVLSVLNA